jgi:hypothetical protein
MSRFSVVIVMLALGVATAALVFARTIPAVSSNSAVATTTLDAVSSTAKVSLAPVTAMDVATSTVKSVLPEISWKRAIATVFWVGEGADGDNGFIHNRSSAWDGEWQTSFGGVDAPEDRCDFVPCAFTPEENPFYIALPYNDLDVRGAPKANAARIPWHRTAKTSILKNRWVAVRADDTTCYGQWEDVGPFHSDDIEYVFGDAENPLNQTGAKAGIDLSPAMRDCLGVGGIASVTWRHVEEVDVPAGPWRTVITGNELDTTR